MSKLRNKRGQFVRGHGKVPRKHHHRRRNPAALALAAKGLASATARRQALLRLGSVARFAR